MEEKKQIFFGYRSIFENMGFISIFYNYCVAILLETAPRTGEKVRVWATALFKTKNKTTFYVI